MNNKNKIKLLIGSFGVMSGLTLGVSIYLLLKNDISIVFKVLFWIIGVFAFHYTLKLVKKAYNSLKKVNFYIPYKLVRRS